MKRVKGLPGPTPGLARYHAAAGADATWDGFGSFEEGQAKAELGTALERMQRGLCAYCEIKLVSGERQIEHFVPRGDPGQGTALELAHGNLLACCRGGTNSDFAPGTRNPQLAYFTPPPRRNRSCGEAKGSKPASVFLDPRQVPAAPPLFRVLRDGTLEPDARACAVHGVRSETVSDHIQHSA